MNRTLIGTISVLTLIAAMGPAFAQTLRVAPPAAISDIDPHGPNSIVRDTLLANRQIYDPLIEFDGDQPIPRLATAWEQIDDTTWRFTLRDDVSFHNGEAMTSADVKASFERIGAGTGGLAALWTQLESVETPDTNTVEVTMKAPVGPFLRNVSLLQILPASEIDAIGTTYGAQAVLSGTGPFRVKDFRPSQTLELEANAAYWDGAPKIDGLRMQAIPELAGRVTALINNEIDATWFLPDDQVALLEGTQEISIEVVPSALYYYNWYNAEREPFNDVRVRQALWHAVDIEQLIGDLLPQTGKVAQAPIASTVFGYAAQEPYAYDPEKALVLLTQAGYPDGFSANIKYSEAQGPELEQLVLSFVSYWAEIGVDVTPISLEHPVWTRDLRELDWDMTMATNPTYTLDADYTLGRLYTANRSGYSHPDLTAALLNAQQESDQELRRALYGEAIAHIWNEAIGIFPAEIQAVYAYRDSVSGIELSPTLTPRFRAVSID